MNMIDELISVLKQKKLSREKLSKLKNQLCKKYKIRQPPTDIEILLHATPEDISEMNLVVKPMRTQSGVAVVAVMSYPFACKHGRCLYCPGGPSSFFGDVPQSYTGREPATMRAIRNKYDAYLQVFNRLEQYIALGHMPDKIELIVMGGTFPSFDKKYQEEFIMYSLKAMNDFGQEFFSDGELDFLKYKEFFEMPGDMRDDARVKRIQSRMLKLKGKSTLAKEQKRNENSKIRCVGLTLETRPDFAKLDEASNMLRLGGTRVEVGVQSVYDDILRKIKRGHSVKDTIDSFRILKDLGFKINAHYMIGLPGSDEKKDIAGIKKLFSDPDFKPDMLKLYPCLVIEGTELYSLWKKKKYVPLTTEKAIRIIAEAKKFVPPWCRIMRIQRDVPSTMICAGPIKTNLRQDVRAFMKKKGIFCNCIRCREIGSKAPSKNTEILVKQYKASKGEEFFISAEDRQNKALIGFCRLRFPSQNLRKEIAKNTALIRELHVYGTAIPVGAKGKVQHKGYGTILLKRAEEIAVKNKKKKMVIISGIGVREYYVKKFGYKKDGPYVSKLLE
jgi:elongator complex protein 3